jgi:hypothetical protein
MQTILAGLVALLIARMIPQNRILVLYSSCCFDRMGIRLADYVVTGLRARGEIPGARRCKGNRIADP